MQDIHVILRDPQLEQAVLRLAKQHQQNLQELIITALSHYIAQEAEQPTITVQKLDPFRYSQAPAETFQSPLQHKLPLVFSDIDDSVGFAKKLRQQAWQRHE